jgi:hypothetical protein
MNLHTFKKGLKYIFAHITCIILLLDFLLEYIYMYIYICMYILEIFHSKIDLFNVFSLITFSNKPHCVEFVIWRVLCS